LVSVLFAVAAVVAGGAILLLGRGPRKPPVAASADDVEVAPSVPVAAPAPAVAPQSSPVAAAAAPLRRAPGPAGSLPSSEDQLMTTLRDLGASDPARTLDLAREGNRRFPSSADAPERSWMICKSLAALGHFAAAQDEARQVVARYPGTTWAGDLRRHLLTQPPSDPGQRGYGRSSELD
jgi:hypothetical protein